MSTEIAQNPGNASIVEHGPQPTMVDITVKPATDTPPTTSPPPAAQSTAEYRYLPTVTLFPSKALPETLYNDVQKLEQIYKLPILFLIHADTDADETAITDAQFLAFKEAHGDRCVKTGCAVVIHSPGGEPHAAYRLALLLRKHYGKYLALIPVYAKSAATLLSLGADEIHLGRHAELGPLDMQIHEPAERDHQFSALEEVQALELLHETALNAAIDTAISLKNKFKKKYDVLLPMALEFAANLWSPMFAKVDVVHWTKMARQLRIGEDYAERLLKRQYGALAPYIAEALVKNYPDHNFAIEKTEADRLLEKVTGKSFGLKTKDMNQEAAAIAERIINYVQKTNMPHLLGGIERRELEKP